MSLVGKGLKPLMHGLMKDHDRYQEFNSILVVCRNPLMAGQETVLKFPFPRSLTQQPNVEKERCA